MADQTTAPKTLSKIHNLIVEILRQNPHGVTIYEIRALLPDIEIQQHLDKRVRELRYFYDVPLVRVDGKAVYVFRGERAEPILDTGHIPAKLRAEVLHEAHGRCQMCGRTIAEQQVQLQVDHKVPRNWGGETVRENLWAICQLCNGGKRDFFSSLDDAKMEAILKFESVYERILETLRLSPDAPTPSWLLQFVANFEDWQEDWQKRLRELRYPVIGIKIASSRKKNETGKWEAAYQIILDRALPTDHKFLIKEYERKNRKRKKS